MSDDVYAELRAAAPQERLEAMILFWAGDSQNPRADYFLRLGFAVAQPDGWKQIAPAWLRAWRAKEQVKKRKGNNMSRECLRRIVLTAETETNQGTYIFNCDEYEGVITGLQKLVTFLNDIFDDEILLCREA